MVGLTYEHGILLLTTTPGPRKLFEIYNQVAFAAIGHPADIEKLRKAVIDIAHVEAFNFSASDISLQRLVSFGLGPLIVQEIYGIMRQIREQEGTSMLLVEQNANIALNLADHAYLLETGTVAMSGESHIIRDDENVRRSYLGY